MSEKDPRNAMERLTHALNAIATSPRNAKERCLLAWSILAPLSADGFGPVFPRKEDKAIFEQIMTNDDSLLSNDDNCEKFLNLVWDLYWRMSENQQYR